MQYSVHLIHISVSKMVEKGCTTYNLLVTPLFLFTFFPPHPLNFQDIIKKKA